MDSRSEGPSSVDNHARCRTGEELTNDRRRKYLRDILQRLLADSMDVGQVMLPDDVLLTIFDFCVDKYAHLPKELMHAWQPLVHVCRQWRSLVFGSPRRLNLRLFCRSSTTWEMLDVWPALPLVIRGSDFPPEDIDNIIALIENGNRVCQIIVINVPSWHLEKITAAMQKRFAELTDLQLWSNDQVETVLPDSFLGGSAPCLQSFALQRIPFPGLPKLLLSATHLVDLRLDDIPHSGYISPEAMATALSTTTALKSLSLEFESPQSRPDLAAQRPPPPTRSVLPTLTSFGFKGVSEYLDDFVAHIDAPLLNELHTTSFNDIVFDTPQLVQFISRTPMSNLLEKAYVIFEAYHARVYFLITVTWLQSPRSGNLMQKAQLASFVSGAGLHLVLASPFHFRGPLYRRASKFSARLARQHRGHGMAVTNTPIYRCQESVPIRKIWGTYRACPGKACWGQDNGSVSLPAEYFLGGARAIGTCPGLGSDWKVRCRAAGHRSPYSRYPLGKRGEGGGGEGGGGG